MVVLCALSANPCVACVRCHRAGAEDQALACCVARRALRVNKGERAGVRPPRGIRVHPVIHSVGLWWGCCSEASSGLLEKGRVGASPSSVTRVPLWCLDSRGDEANGRGRALLEAVGEGCGLHPWRNGSTELDSTRHRPAPSCPRGRLRAW